MANDSTARRLIWIPIIHTPEDMGRLREEVKRAHGRASGGVAGWEAYARAAMEFWRAARRIVESLSLDYSKVRLYQDALPVCGYEEKIVSELAHTGGANYRLLAELMSKGAALTGTESAHLLVEEYELSRKALQGSVSAEHEERANTLLNERDRFIARRIDETLRPEETGLLFLGRAHSLDGLMAADIKVDRIDPHEKGR